MDSGHISAALGALILGIPTLTLGVAARTGLWRWGWVERYRNPAYPRYLRNFSFGAVPIGAGMLLLVPAFRCSQDSCMKPAAWLFLIGLTLIAAGIYFCFSPPDWMKPRWLLQAEHDGWKTYTGITPRGRVFGWMWTLILAGGFTYLLVSGSVGLSISGLAFGLTFALIEWNAQRGRRKRQQERTPAQTEERGGER